MKDTRPLPMRLQEAAQLWVPPRVMENLCMESAEVILALEVALEDLLNWARANISPNDANTPHDLLIAATTALAKLKGEPS